MFHYLLILTLIVLGSAIMSSLAWAETAGQELHIYSKGDAHFIGAELTGKNALNLISVTVWKQRWQLFIEEGVKLESADSKEIKLEELKIGDALEIKGRLGQQPGILEPVLIRDLSIKKDGVSILAPSVITPSTTPVFTKETSKKPTITQSLKLGMRGPEVSFLQEFLQKNSWGIPNDGPVTGYFGKVTEKALMNFQKAKGLAAVGMVGPKTRELINSLFTK